MTAAVRALAARFPELRLSPATTGILLGLLTALIWGANQSAARYGVINGLSAFDVGALRFGSAALILAPWLLRQGMRDAAGVGWPRALILTVMIGPLFFGLNVGGYAFSPLAHGAVILPATFTMASLALSSLVFGEKQGRERLIGVAVMVAGLALIAGPEMLDRSATTPIGDAMFALAALFWAGTTVLTRRWGVGPLHLAALVAVLSSLIYLPGYFALGGGKAILEAAPATLLIEIFVQGILAGVIAVQSFTRSVELLGPSRASIFPALVPATAIVIGIPLTGELPTFGQLGGLAIVSLGLIIAVGLFGSPREGASR